MTVQPLCFRNVSRCAPSSRFNTFHFHAVFAGGDQLVSDVQGQSELLFSRTVRSGRLIFSLWRVVGWLPVCGQLFQLFTPGGSPGSNFKY